MGSTASITWQVGTQQAGRGQWEGNQSEHQGEGFWPDRPDRIVAEGRPGWWQSQPAPGGRGGGAGSDADGGWLSA